MTKKIPPQKVQEVLNTLFPDPAIPLNHRDPFTLLIAVILSAQCTDERVNKITPQLFALACTPEEMACADPDQVEHLIRPCGLGPSKARALVGLSKILVEKHGAQVPDSFEALEELPGVGHKTASVMMIQAFDKPAFPVDTHIHRCAKRWGLSEGKNVEKTERDLKRCFPQSSWAKLHLQIIYFARRYCPARGHDPSSCPLCKLLT